MKTSTYKRKNGKVEKVEKVDFNNNAETVLLNEYQDLFNKIDKGSKVLNFVKTSEYKDSLLDVLQEVMAEMLNTKVYKNYKTGQIKNLLYKYLETRTINNLKKESTLDIFKNDHSEYVDDSSYGVTKQYLNEMILEIKNILTVDEFKIFKLYNIDGYSMDEIANKLDTYKMEVSRQIKNINNKIIGTDRRDGLCYKTLFDSRYVAYQTNKKKRQHRRKTLTRKEIISKSSQVKHIDKSNYTKQASYIPETIPSNKAMQYPTKQYFEHKPFDYMNNGLNIIEYVSSLTYNNTNFLDYNPIFKNAYRHKRNIRQYKRNCKLFRKEINRTKLFDGHKSYLFTDGINPHFINN